MAGLPWVMSFTEWTAILMLKLTATPLEFHRGCSIWRPYSTGFFPATLMCHALPVSKKTRQQKTKTPFFYIVTVTVRTYYRSHSILTKGFLTFPIIKHLNLFKYVLGSFTCYIENSHDLMSSICNLVWNLTPPKNSNDVWNYESKPVRCI